MYKQSLTGVRFFAYGLLKMQNGFQWCLMNAANRRGCHDVRDEPASCLVELLPDIVLGKVWRRGRVIGHLLCQLERLQVSELRPTCYKHQEHAELRDVFEAEGRTVRVHAV